ncbi:hypothetical protein F0562_027934 [Nyssa sinensis]|uniref:Poly [ADP-ribose] polymerase n=1 Tax=Nyssa sinensis TaxID=561372 RepID=A0A5J5B4W8_9ASTE|nr:hypothetical protein F0562_027934 [Nyssa sinensis]
MVMVNPKDEAANSGDRIGARVLPKLLSLLPSSSFSNPDKEFSQGPDCYTQFLMENYSSFKQSGLPYRFMYYQDGSWVDISSEVLAFLRSGFLEGKAVMEVELDGAQFLFDFYRMLQIDLKTGNQRSIAWVDVDGKCFFPKTFVDGSEEFADSSLNCEIELAKASDNPKIEIADVTENLAAENPKINIEIRIGDNSGSSKRKRENVEPESEKAKEKMKGSSSEDHPDELKRQRLIMPHLQLPRWPKARMLKEIERPYSVISKIFLSKIGNVEPGARITAIHQCMRTCPLSKARYEVFQRQTVITKAARGESNKTFAWHGTSGKAVASILTYGFGKPSQVSGSEVHGLGIYLSRVGSPEMSAMLSEVDGNGEKHVILCQVILGKCEKVELGSKQQYPSSVHFDTGVDDLTNPKWFVIWCANMNNHILPEFVVSYKTSECLPGQLGVP